MIQELTLHAYNHYQLELETVVLLWKFLILFFQFLHFYQKHNFFDGISSSLILCQTSYRYFNRLNW